VPPIVLFLLVGCAIAFAIGLVFNAPTSLGYGCFFSAAWYMGIGGAAIVAAAANERWGVALLWFALYGVLAALVVFTFALLGTSLGVVARFIGRAIERDRQY
jgi:hypothetical protein